MDNIIKRENGTNKIGTLTPTSKNILKELIENPSGLRANTIIKLINKPRRTVYNNLNQLKEAGLIKNIYPIWQLCQIQSENLKLAQLLKKSKIQLHDFSFVIRLIKKPDWWERRGNKLMKFKEFQIKNIKWGNNPYHQLMKDKFIIQLFSNSMIFISKKHYYGEDSYDCFIQATKDFLDMYSYIENKFNFKFFFDEAPQALVRSHHYVRLRDAVAKRCKRKGSSFEVVINEKLRLWVDMSEPQGVEAGHKDYAPEDMRIYNNYVSDIIQKNPPKPSTIAQEITKITPLIADFKEKKIDGEFILKALNKSAELHTNQALLTDKVQQNQQGIQNNQQDFADQLIFLKENLKTHFKVLNDNAKVVKQLGNAVEGLTHAVSYQQRRPSRNLIFLMNQIKKPKDTLKYKKRISSLSKEEKVLLENHLFEENAN